LSEDNFKLLRNDIQKKIVFKLSSYSISYSKKLSQFFLLKEKAIEILKLILQVLALVSERRPRRRWSRQK